MASVYFATIVSQNLSKELMLANFQVHTVNVQQPIPTKGSSGGEKDTWTTTVANMPCRVIDTASVWKFYYSAKQLDCTHQIFTNAGPTIKAGYQLIWHSVVLRVIGVVDLGGHGSVTRIDCQELLLG